MQLETIRARAFVKANARATRAAARRALEILEQAKLAHEQPTESEVPHAR